MRWGVGWSVILSPSGTHMKHDGRMRGGIFHCQLEGGMVIHFFLSLLVAIPFPFYCIFPFLSFWTPLTHCRNNDNLIILSAWPCRGREQPKQRNHRALPMGSMKQKSAIDRQGVWTFTILVILFNSWTHFYTLHTHIGTYTHLTSPSKSALLWPGLRCLLLLGLRSSIRSPKHNTMGTHTLMHTPVTGSKA